ncbi:adenosine deaminase [Ferrimonas balearica DSM 9799]|uniref:adenosine deaminase n=1 Tax=Ferrimonas balearica (strain DSM 9799 / CCM 4581 / KCTC 23876 / PAT) TaxID=550540 RepID=E1SR10_FERBD|nr:adenosine deaminase [Ferrimonas balearica]ADN77940.1 adenosine deaminase [Ferrimonas balearica DSM 9799]MBW3141369.1 adenosine deaminase [Ferrimonas balearica]
MIDASLVLTDLHRHLDGSVRPETVLDLGRRFNIALPADTLAALRPYLQVVDRCPSVEALLAKLDYQVAVLGDLNAVHRVARENVEDLALEGVDYAELRFSPAYMAGPHGLAMDGVVEAVIDGVQSAARATGVKVNLIGILCRGDGQEACHRELDAILRQRDHFVACDLAGDEEGFPGDLFVDHFKRVRDAGLNVTIHAGEPGPPSSIWQAVNELGATRLGHATTATQDPRLLAMLAERGIGIESCPTSNVHANSVADYEVHPIRQFVEAGIKVCLNTDDPGVSANSVPFEYRMAHQRIGLTLEQLRQIQHNGLELAFISEAERAQLRARKAARGG